MIFPEQLQDRREPGGRTTISKVFRPDCFRSGSELIVIEALNLILFIIAPNCEIGNRLWVRADRSGTVVLPKAMSPSGPFLP